MSTERGICFVIMPFSKTTEKHTKEYWTRHFETFLKPLIEENPELEARRSKALRGDILREIVTNLGVAPLVVADLTDHNCNVYWELGVRQSFKHGTVTIAEKSTQLPFDIGAKSTLFYDPEDHLEMEGFRRQFKEAIQDCLVNPDRPDSHVLETLSGRGTLFEIFRKDEAIRRLDALISECSANLSILEIIHEQAQKNQKNPKKRERITTPLRMAATELLITNRYIDEDEAFFQSAESCWRWVMSMNSQLLVWEHSPDYTEKWFLRDFDEKLKVLTKLKTKVETARKKIGKRL